MFFQIEKLIQWLVGLQQLASVAWDILLTNEMDALTRHIAIHQTQAFVGENTKFTILTHLLRETQIIPCKFNCF